MDDLLPKFGEPIGWGTWARDHNHLGLFADGPQPARNPLTKYLQPVAPDPTALPPGLARLCLTLVARRTIKLRSVLHRQALPLVTKGGRLKPLQVGRKRVAP